jgi:glycosyltransferase involved in cell wall biosynthesis
MTRVCLFGGYDPAYPRTRILARGLALAGAEVVEARGPEHRAMRRYPALVAAWARVARGVDVTLVPCFRHKDVPLARALCGRRPLVFDPLVSRWDTLVGDWRRHAEGSAQARWNRTLDRWAFTLPDVVLCDTWEHGALFERLGAPRARLRRVLVGAEEEFFAVGAAPEAGPLRIVYVGGFLPLHGVATVIEAVTRLERDAASLPEFTVELVGDGMQYQAMRDFAARAGARRLAFAGPRAYAEAPATLAGAHVVLGAFGASEKAGRVIPHKVYQGLAAGRAVVTGDGAGVREVFEPGVHLEVVPRADAAALAAALAALLGDPRRRAALAARGRARALEIATPAAIGGELERILADLPRRAA